MQIPGQMFQAVYIFYCGSRSFLFLLVSYSTPLIPVFIMINSFTVSTYPPLIHTSPSPRPPQNKERSNRKNHKPLSPSPCSKRMGCMFSMPSSYRRERAWHKVRKQQWEDHLSDEKRYYQEQWNRYRNARADGTTLTNKGVDYSGGRRRRMRFELE